MNKCYTVEWNSRGGDPKLVEVFKSFDAALKHCVECIEESKTGKEKYNIVVETAEFLTSREPPEARNCPTQNRAVASAATWVELHLIAGPTEEDRLAALVPIEWYKIKTWEFANE